MLDIGLSEMLIVGVVALVVVGPKDLPKMFHTIGQFTGKARGMAREFQRAMDVAAKEAGVDGLAKDIRKVTSGRALKDAVGFDEIDKEFRDIGREVSDVSKSPKAKVMPKAAAKKAEAFDDESEADELDAQDYDADHDTDLAERNAEVSAVEQLRLTRARKIAAARKRAADIRAQSEADVAQAATTEATNAATEPPFDPVAAANKAAAEPRDWKPKRKEAAKQSTPPDTAPDTAPDTTADTAAEPSAAPQSSRAQPGDDTKV